MTDTKTETATSDGKPDFTRIRQAVDLFLTILLGLCLAYWFCVQGELEGGLIAGGFFLGGLAIRIFSSKIKIPNIILLSDFLILVAVVIGLLGFYISSGDWKLRWFPPLEWFPGAHALFSLTVFYVLTRVTIRMAPKKPEVKKHPLAVIFIILGFLFSTGVAFDLYFIHQDSHCFKIPRYHPFLTFPASSDESFEWTYAYNHAQEERVKDLRGREFAQKKPEDTIRIILNGASTMFGHRIPSKIALPALLQKRLEDLYPDKNFEILLIAWSGKQQHNELIDSVVTIPHWKPDLVISLNGWNEFWYGEHHSNRFEGMPYRQYQIERIVNLPTPLLFLCNHSYFFNNLLLHTNTFMDEKRYEIKKRNKYEPPRYFEYLRRGAKALADEGIPYVYAFCPNVAERKVIPEKEKKFLTGNPLVNEDTGKRMIADAPKRRAKVEKILEDENQQSYDVMTFINNTDEVLFFDCCHFTKEGMEKLADDMAERIIPWIEEGRKRLKK